MGKKRVKTKKYDLKPMQKKAGLADVAYEMEQLFQSVAGIQNTVRGRSPNIPGRPSPTVEVYLEGLLLHGRVLTEFFEHAKRSTRLIGKDHRAENADILAADYDFRPKKIHLDRSIRDRLNKELAHLSYERTGKPWDIDQFFLPLLERCVEFAKSAVSGPVRAIIDDDPEQVQRWSRLHTLLGTILHFTPRTPGRQVVERSP